MKVYYVTIAVFVFLVLAACTGKEKKLPKSGKIEHISGDTALAHVDGVEDEKIFQIPHAYIKYNSSMGVVREMWFTDYGKLQYEEAWRIIDGKRMGSQSWVIDGYKYDMQMGSQQMVKTPYKPEPATEYEKLTREQREQYQIKKIGDETMLGKYCSVVEFQKPMPTTVWLYKGIPLKSHGNTGREEIIIEAEVFNESPVDANMFVIPEGLTIIEL